MYDWEINNFIQERNCRLNQNEFLAILNTSPQINHQKFEPHEDKFHLWTENGNEFVLEVHYKDMED